MILQEWVQPKALVLIGIYLGTGLAIGWSIVSFFFLMLVHGFTGKAE